MKNAVQLIKQCSLLYAESDQQLAQESLSLYNALFKEVFYAQNGVDALHLYQQHKQHIDLIITDVDLPQLNGIEMITRIRAQDGYKLPVIFCTQKTNDNILLQCLKLGTADYILKPVQHKTHLGILIKVLRPIYDMKLMYVMNQELEIYQKSADSQLLISKTDTKGRITYANELFYQVSGYTQEELIGKPHNIVRHENMPKEIFEELWQTITRGEVWSGHIQNKAKDGSSYYVDAKIFPIKDNEGNIVEYMSFRQDVTSHILLNHKAKNALKQTKLNYSKIYDEAIEKAKNFLAKDIENLELAVKTEREITRTQTSKRILAEKMLAQTIEEKNEEIRKWKNKLKEAGQVLGKISATNKKVSQDNIYYKNSLEVVSEKLEASQKKIGENDEDKLKLYKIIDNKDDVINHLEEELLKYKNKGK
ncbi:MAG: response regulator [Sulfurimonadaceae bacterium]